MKDFNERYIAARKAVIAQDLQRLNSMQRSAALATEGPLLLLAGAGSGKTTVLIQRIYNLLTYGVGSDQDTVPEWAAEEDLAFLEGFPENPSPEDWSGTASRWGVRAGRFRDTRTERSFPRPVLAAGFRA